MIKSFLDWLKYRDNKFIDVSHLNFKYGVNFNNKAWRRLK